MSVDPNRRSTSNSNSRGSSYQRRSRRAWLVEQFRADVDVIRIMPRFGDDIVVRPRDAADCDRWLLRLKAGHNGDPYAGLPFELIPVCRCFRCGKLLLEDEVSPDRWPVPGVRGGDYGKTNIRPSCEECNTKLGSALGHARKAAKRAAKAARAVRVALPPGARWMSYPGVAYRHVVLANCDTAPCGVTLAHWQPERKKTRCPGCVQASA